MEIWEQRYFHVLKERERHHRMRRFLWLGMGIGFLLLSAIIGFAQARPAISSGPVIYPLPTSYYGYKPTLLPGSIRTIPVGLWCANVTATSYTSSPSGTVIVAANNMKVGDTVIPIGFLSTPMAYAVGNGFHVTEASASQFTIDFKDGAGRGSATDWWEQWWIRLHAYFQNIGGRSTTNTEANATVRKIAGQGCTGKVKWEIINTGTTAETYRLQSINGASDTGLVAHPVIDSTIPVVRLQVGPTEGVASKTGDKAAGTLAIHSTVSFTLRATSIDDPTKTADMPMIVTANGAGYPNGSGGHIQGKAFASPGFRTVYTDRHIPIVSQVLGNVNQMVHTTIESKPSGGDAVLSFATFPQPDFYSGTVQGLYRMKLCPAVDSSSHACAHVSYWVEKANPPPANPDLVEQTPCPTGAGPTVMGIHWATIIDIGPSKPFHDFLTAIPQTWAGPMLVRFHNEGPPGQPTTIHNQVQVNPPSSGGPFADNKPSFFMCGVPNSSGELPVLDADKATVNPWASMYIVGPYSMFGFAGATGGNPLPDVNLRAWNTITTQNVKFIHANKGYTYVSVQDGSSQPWGESSGPRPSNSIQNFNLIGTRIDLVGDPIFDNCNAANQGMHHCTEDTYSEGNHLSGYGYPDSYLAHGLYRQSLRIYSMMDLFDGAIEGSQGMAWFKDRGSRSFHMYSRVAINTASKQAGMLSGHNENQDAYNLLNLDEFWGYQGAAACNTTYSVSLGCLSGWTLEPIAWQAAVVEEHNRTEYMIGNAIAQPNVNKSIGIAMDHSWYSYQPYGGGYSGHEWFPENLPQNLFFAYNTVSFGADSANRGMELLIEDTRLNFSGADESIYYLLQPQYYPEIWMSNNIVPLDKQTPQCDYGCNVWNVYARQITHFQTNITGTITTPGDAFNSDAGAFNTNGWTLKPAVADWGPIDPITDHLTGWSSANFLTYPAYPIDRSTLKPATDSAAVGKATALTGDLAAYPPRYNAVDAKMSPFTLRAEAGTLGAYDSGHGGGPTPPTLTGITVAPSASIAIGSTQQMTCTAHMSDSTTPACSAVGAPAWASSAPAIASVSSAGLVTGVAAGTAIISASMQSVNSTANPTITVTSTAPPVIHCPCIFEGPVTIKGPVAINPPQ